VPSYCPCHHRFCGVFAKKENESGEKCETVYKSNLLQPTSCHLLGSLLSDGNCMKISGLAIKHQSHFPF